jgi:enoyl-CoA hydratase/carnithine racemase
MQYAHAGVDAQALQCVAATVDDGVLTICLRRPEEGNAIDARLSRELDALLARVAADDAVRVVVLRGAGADFCVGLDLGEPAAMANASASQAPPDTPHGWRTRGLRRLPQPVIAMVHGQCLGEALAILEACDIVLAASDAAFGAIGAREHSGLRGACAKALPRVMAARAARYYLLTAERFDGEEAARNGLATRCVPPAQLEAATYELARELAGKDAIALRFTKETLDCAPSMSWDAVLSYTAAKQAELKVLQAGRPSSRAAAVENFLAGKSKPGLGA